MKLRSTSTAVALALMALGAPAWADMEAAKAFLDAEIGDLSTLARADQEAEMQWFVDAAAPFAGMDIKVVSETITTHEYEAKVLAPAFTAITGIKVTHDLIGEGDVVRIVDLVEKPDPKDAPSNLAVIGRYVLRPEIYDILEDTEPGKGNEIQLTDALRHMATGNIAGGVLGIVFRGRRYDTGDKLDYIKAIVRLALQRPDLGPALENWLDVESHRRP